MKKVTLNRDYFDARTVAAYAEPVRPETPRDTKLASWPAARSQS